MKEEDSKTAHMDELPTELLMLLFSYLPAKTLMQCRRVCGRWKQIVEHLTSDDTVWWKFCKRDFPRNYRAASTRVRSNMEWFDIYRSLSLWPYLSKATEAVDEFASASMITDEIKNFQILTDGIIAVHKRGAIVYYEIDSLKLSKRRPITGDYLRYAENDDAIVILSYHLQLYIVRKVLRSPHHVTNVTFDNVKMFLLVNFVIYYVTLTDQVFKCDLDDAQLNGVLLKRMDEGVVALGYTDTLHVLSFKRNIHTIRGQISVLNCTLGSTSNLLHQLNLYNLLEQLDWRIYYQWMFVLNRSVPDGPLRGIVSIRMYGDIVFIGTDLGVFRIYYSPFENGEFDLFNAEPVKQYNFMERRDCPVLSMCPILQIDVMEIHDGHVVIVAMPKKVAVLRFEHNFTRTTPVALLEYREVPDIFRINDT